MEIEIISISYFELLVMVFKDIGYVANYSVKFLTFDV